MAVKGWIRDYRQELESEIWQMPPLYHRVWQWLKYQANHTDGTIPLRNGQILNVSCGQHLTSYRLIAEGVGWYERGIWKIPNPKTIRTILSWMVRRGMVIVGNCQSSMNHQTPITNGLKSNTPLTLVTICNYSLYQEAGDSKSNTEGNSQVTAEKQSLDTNKNDENEKNKNNDSLKDFRTRFEKFWSAYPKKKSKGDAEKAFLSIKPSEQLLAEMLTSLERAKTSFDWAKEKGKFIPYPATWIRAKGWLDEYTQSGGDTNGADKGSAGPDTKTSKYPTLRVIDGTESFS